MPNDFDELLNSIREDGETLVTTVEVDGKLWHVMGPFCDSGTLLAVQKDDKVYLDIDPARDVEQQIRNGG